MEEEGVVVDDAVSGVPPLEVNAAHIIQIQHAWRGLIGGGGQ